MKDSVKQNDDDGGGQAPMRRWNFFIEQKWLDRINRDKGQYGFRTSASFIRFIIIRFFEDIDKQQARKR